jgi:hypothetical protein
MNLLLKGPDGDYDKLNISMVISYFVTVDQVMIATVRNFQSDDFNLTTRNAQWNRCDEQNHQIQNLGQKK